MDHSKNTGSVLKNTEGSRVDERKRVIGKKICYYTPVYGKSENKLVYYIIIYTEDPTKTCTRKYQWSQIEKS